jgi:hypothetical protein
MYVFLLRTYGPIILLPLSYSFGLIPGTRAPFMWMIIPSWQKKGFFSQRYLCICIYTNTHIQFICIYIQIHIYVYIYRGEGDNFLADDHNNLVGKRLRSAAAAEGECMRKCVHV